MHILNILFEWLVTHQMIVFGVIFGVLGVFAALYVIPRAGSLIMGLFADLAVGETAAEEGFSNKWVIILAIVVGIVVGMFIGAPFGSKNPVPGTYIVDVLGMPDPTCEHSGKKLVVFLHGWRGDREDTWKNFPLLVCGDIDFSGVDVLSLGYPTYMVGSNLTMEGFGSWLADKLAANNVSKYEKIAFVAHSIGGLLARRIVIENKPELKNITLLVEIGTPHLGAYGYTKLAYVLGLLPGSALVSQVNADSPFLEKLKSDWNSLPSRPHTFCTGSPNDWVVSLHSAQAECDEKHNYPALDHRELVKPGNQGDDRYKIPMYTVKQYLQ